MLSKVVATTLFIVATTLELGGISILDNNLVVVIIN